MTTDSLDPAAEKWVEEILGYLNLSSGASDTHFLGVFNDLFGALSKTRDSRECNSQCGGTRGPLMA